MSWRGKLFWIEVNDRVLMLAQWERKMTQGELFVITMCFLYKIVDSQYIYCHNVTVFSLSIKYVLVLQTIQTIVRSCTINRLISAN